MLGSILRALVALFRPPLVGAAGLLGLAAYAGKKAASDSRVAGVEASDVTHAIQTHFGAHVHRATLLIAAVAALSGLALGLAASILVRLRAWLGGEPPPRSPRYTLEGIAVLMGLYAVVLCEALAERPQLYEDAFYQAGGLRRLLQVTCTDILGPSGVLALGALALLLYLLAGRGRRVAARLAALGSWRPGKQALATSGLALALLALLWPIRRLGAVESPAPAAGRPSLIILAADSLRPDQLTAAVAPRLAAFAAESARFERALVSLPRTFPSWVTLLTGRYPHHHGIRNMFPSRGAREHDFDALPARLGAAGYQTAVVSDYAGDIFPRIRLGFGQVDAPTFHLGELVRQRALESQPALLPFLDSRAGRMIAPSMLGLNRAPDADGVTRRALAAVDRMHDSPFFLVVFYSTTHFPYASPAPGYSRFTDSSYRGRFKYQKVNALGREAPLDEADIQQIRALYRGAVSVVDGAMGHFLDGLHERGLDRSSVVLVTADHGENLFENGRGHGHGDHLFGEEALRVPLLVRDGRAPHASVIPGLSRDVDLAPTLYDLAQVTPPGDLDGASLVPALGGAPLTTDAAFAETGLWFTEEIPGVPATLRLRYPDISRMGEVLEDAGDDVVLQDRYFPLTVLAKHRALMTAERKLILAPTRQGLVSLLFDTKADPDCLHDLAADRPDEARKMRERLLEWVLQDRELELRGLHLVTRHGVGASEGEHAGFRLGGP